MRLRVFLVFGIRLEPSLPARRGRRLSDGGLAPGRIGSAAPRPGAPVGPAASSPPPPPGTERGGGEKRRTGVLERARRALATAAAAFSARACGAALAAAPARGAGCVGRGAVAGSPRRCFRRRLPLPETPAHRIFPLSCLTYAGPSAGRPPARATIRPIACARRRPGATSRDRRFRAASSTSDLPWVPVEERVLQRRGSTVFASSANALPAPLLECDRALSAPESVLDC
jgi:hypothetical protein